MRAYIWNGRRWVESAAVPAIIDRATSWRHRDGTMSGFALHRQRFAVPEAAWEEAFSLLDVPGDSFPRISTAAGELRLDIRPAPAPRPTTSLTLASPAWPDPRTAPLVKGPDLDRLARHRAASCVPGTDDVTLGDLAETTTGALVGWRRGSLIVPAGVHLPSVTQRQVVRRAEELGIPVLRGALSLDEPIWFLNALHGVSPVRRVVAEGADMEVPHHPDAAAWAAWWWGSFARPSVR